MAEIDLRLVTEALQKAENHVEIVIVGKPAGVLIEASGYGRFRERRYEVFISLADAAACPNDVYDSIRLADRKVSADIRGFSHG